MPDMVEKAVDKSIADLSQKLKKEYNKAYIALKNEADAYFKQFREEDMKMLLRVNKGEITRKEYVKWRQNKMMYGKRYNDLVKKLAHDLTQTDVLATKMITGRLPYIYTLSANYEAMNLEKIIGNPFTVYNEEAVARLVMADKLYLPPKVDVPKDTLWNMQRIHSAILQGIVSGERLSDVASRLMTVTHMNEVQAMRTARTIHTAVCNEGRMDSFKRAENMGATMGRQWLAIHDERTRDAHIELDRQIKDLDEPFENSLGKIRFPADPQASPANSYNCRCALRGVIAGHMYKGGSQKEYNEWIKGKSKNL